MKKIRALFSTPLLSAALLATTAGSFDSNANTNLINGELSRIEINRNITKTLNSAKFDEADQWISYQVEMEPNNGMPCCFQGEHHQGCRLDKRRNSWVTTNEVYEDSKTLNIYFKWNDNQPGDLFLAGSECAVNAGGNKIFELSTVSQKQSIEFLQRYIEPNTIASKQFGNKALAAIAMHQGVFAHDVLDKLANRSDDKLSRQAIFWLGEARNKAGYISLVNIVDDQKRTLKSRKKAVFALSQNSYPKSKQKLVQLATKENNEKIQGQAIFWLADSKHPETIDVIDTVLNSDASQYVKNKAIFSLSELDSDDSWRRLVEIAKYAPLLQLRKKAVFWLSQNHQRKAKPILLDIIKGNNPESVKIEAVFAVSQLTEPEATDGLLEIMTDTKNRHLRRKAIFWLGQSSDPRALAALEDIFTASIN